MYSSVFSDRGVREQNEDTVYPAPGQPVGSLFIVADGLGGHADGKAASELAVSALRQILETEDPATFVLGGHRLGEQELWEAFLSDAVRQVAATVRHTARQRGSDMGSTLLAVLLRNGRGYCAHVGDCALFVAANGQLPPAKLTVEHRRGASLTRSLGTSDQVTPDVFSFEFSAAAALVLGCDGFWEHLSAERIGELLATRPPFCAAEELGRAALAAGSQDNISVIMAAGDEFVQQHAAEQAAAYEAALAQQPVTSETAARQQELEAFRRQFIVGGDAPAVAVSQPEGQTWQQQVAALEAQVQEQAGQLVALRAELAAAGPQTALQEQRSAHQDFVARDLERQLKENQEQVADLKKQLTALEARARQSLEAINKQLQEQKEAASTAEEQLNYGRRQYAELKEQNLLFQQQVREKDLTIRELQQQVQLAEQMNAQKATPAAQAAQAAQLPYNAMDAHRAKDFGSKLYDIWKKYPQQCEDVVKAESYFKNLERWLSATNATK